jgi:hypothetical protein
VIFQKISAWLLRHFRALLLRMPPLRNMPGERIGNATRIIAAKSKITMAKRTTIEIYTRQRTLLGPLYGTSAGPCRLCDAAVLMLIPECVADILRVNSEVVAELIEKELLHVTGSNALLICSNSVLTVLANSQKESQEKP